jgi:hypothetical protein
MNQSRLLVLAVPGAGANSAKTARRAATITQASAAIRHLT